MPWKGLLAVLVVLAMAAWLFVSRANGERDLQAALAAHREGDCTQALPRYERVTQGAAMGVADKAEAARRGDECRDFLTAEQARAEARWPEAMAAYEQYLTDHPEGLLNRARVEEGLAGAREQEAGARLTAAEAELQAIADAGAVDHHLVIDQVIDRHLAVARDFPGTAAAGRVPQALLGSYDRVVGPLRERGGPCQALMALNAFDQRSQPELEQPRARAREALPQTLYDCGQERFTAGDYNGAVTSLTQLRDQHPGSPLAAQSRTTLIAAEVAQIQGGGAAELPDPQAEGRTRAGTVRVEIRNDSPETMEVLYSGPASDTVTVEACAGCTTYSVVEPVSGCEGDVPGVTVELPPGTYQVGVRASSGGAVTPYAGTWDLVSGTAYGNCFYIVESSGVS